MDIPSRNQEIIARRLNLEPLASIGASYGISRQRVLVIFDRMASDDEKRKVAELTAARIAPKPEKVPRVPMERLHVSLRRQTALSSDEIRGALAQWCDNPCSLSESDGTNRARRALYVPVETVARLRRECKKRRIAMTATIRGIIERAEK